MPGALLGNLASEFTTSFKSLLPELEENKADAECAQRFIELEKFFMDNAPTAQGFRRFYSVIIQARRAIMLDLSRAETPFQGMEAVNAHLARVLVDYAITAAHPANEAKLREPLEEQGHRATATIFEAIKEDRYVSVKPRSRPKRFKKQQGGKHDNVYFLQSTAESVEGSECRNLSHAFTDSFPRGSGLDVSEVGRMEEVGSPSQSSGDSEIRSQYRSCEEEEGLPSIEGNTRAQSPCQGAHRSWRVCRDKRSDNSVSNILIPKQGGGLRGIHDLRELNKQLLAVRFSMHEIRDTA